ncbi:MAG: cyclic nucleotide-binding domain-containing protein [Gammaproteobacteria bacterium]|nr:cyclic nucleotide-binding domain-containing protein [Gammaproteobacteria bacterium]MDH5799806.1 cyclic nucleotide-binding domain-containing protein [Gammaproteobacteria bacterium]
MTAVKDLLDENLLRTLVPFGDLDDAQLKELHNRYSIETFASGKQIFKKGTTDNKAYYLLSGQVKLMYAKGNVKWIQADSKESRYALTPVQPRKATAIARGKVSVLSIDMSIFEEVINMGYRDGYEVGELELNEQDWMNAFLQSSIFVKLPATNIQALMMRLKERKVNANEVIIRQGDDDGNYYIIKSGRCRVVRKHSPQDNEVELAVLGPGSGFGEESIITHNRRGATITMMEDGQLMVLSRDDFSELLVEPLIAHVGYDEVAYQDNTIFMDVRYYDDYIRDGINGSLFAMLSELRGKLKKLDANKRYVVCSNTGSRAAAAAFLLCQQGLDAVVLRYGLENLPDSVKRGNGETQKTRSVKKVVSKHAIPTLTPINDSTREAMQDPKVRELFRKAKTRVTDHAARLGEAERARRVAEQEVVRLKREAEQARQEAVEARRQAEFAAEESPQVLPTVREAARISELELGYKQAEMEQAIRQAQYEAKRATEANEALKLAEQEIDNMKRQMQLALQQARDEASKTAKAIQRFAAVEAKKQNEQIARIAEKEAQRAREAEQAHEAAQAEIERLKREVEAAKSAAAQHNGQVMALTGDKPSFESMAARSDFEHEAARARAVELANKQAEIEDAMKIARQEAERARYAEQSRQHAETEIARLRHEVMALKQGGKNVEQKTLAAMQKELSEIARKAAAEAKYAREAEQARVRAEQEIERLKQEVKQVTQQAQAQLLADIEKAASERKSMAERMQLIQEQLREQSRKATEQEVLRLKAKLQQEMQQKLQAEVDAHRRDLELQMKSEAEQIRKRGEAESQKLEQERRRLKAETAQRRREEEARQRDSDAKERFLRAELEARARTRLIRKK